MITESLISFLFFLFLILAFIYLFLSQQFLALIFLHTFLTLPVFMMLPDVLEFTPYYLNFLHMAPKGIKSMTGLEKRFGKFNICF